jgi:membrane-bound serine protease (ClpP class)
VWPLILSLVVVGLILILVEVFIPGMIVGIAGFAALVTATVLCYIHYGADVGNKLLIGELILATIFVAWWLKYLPKSPIARRWTLNETVSSTTPVAPPDQPAPHLVHKSGRTLTQLRPAGLALVEDRRLDVVTAGEMIEAGEEVVITKIEGNRIVVKRSAPVSPLST